MILRLPDDALVRTTPEIRKRLAAAKDWTMDTELLAQLIEEVSILAADFRRKKPREVDRPDSARGLVPGASPYSSAIARMAATARVHGRAA